MLYLTHHVHLTALEGKRMKFEKITDAQAVAYIKANSTAKTLTVATQDAKFITWVNHDNGLGLKTATCEISIGSNYDITTISGKDDKLLLVIYDPSVVTIGYDPETNTAAHKCYLVSVSDIDQRGYKV